MVVNKLVDRRGVKVWGGGVVESTKIRLCLKHEISTANFVETQDSTDC